MLQTQLVILFVFALRSGQSSTVWWMENPTFDSPDNWLSGSLPCSQEEIVFPKFYSALLPLPQKVNINGLILPREGALLLQEDSTISFSNGASDGRECTNGYSQQATVKKVPQRNWFDPHSWSGKQNTANAAVPDIERIPCNNDSVVIPAMGALAIDLDGISRLRMGQLNLGGSQISREYLENLFGTELGQVIFQHADQTGVQYFNEPICGCHHADLLWEYEWNVCKETLPSCQRPRCLVPVTPLGHCCSICGSVVKIAMDHCDGAVLSKLRQLIVQAITEEDLSSKLDYHVSFINAENDGKQEIILQAIVVDRDTYNQESVDFMTRLSQTTNWKDLFQSKHTLQYFMSGVPYNPDATFITIFLFFICIMSIIALVILARYSPDNRFVTFVTHIPPWIHEPRRWRDFIFRSSFVFARFHNTAHQPDGEQNVIVEYNAEHDEIRERAFDNPMFAEGSNEERKNTSPAVSTQMKGTHAVKVEDEQELTEIDLDSSSGENDDDDN